MYFFLQRVNTIRALPVMSVCSSAASERSVVYDGAEMTVEQMLDQLIRDIQGGLNNLQVNLRNMCALEDQQVDDDQDFREMVSISDTTEDLVTLLVHHLTELPPVLHEIRGPAPPDSKAWFTAHQAQRRAQAAAEKERLREESRAAKEEEKADKALAKAAIAVCNTSKLPVSR
jgi:hypothetical protein